MKAKRAFERHCDGHGVKVLHDHADNGRFADLLFLRDIADQKKRITYCGVNAHFQKGVAEKRIRDLQERLYAHIPLLACVCTMAQGYF